MAPGLDVASQQIVARVMVVPCHVAAISGTVKLGIPTMSADVLGLILFVVVVGVILVSAILDKLGITGKKDKYAKFM